MLLVFKLNTILTAHFLNITCRVMKNLLFALMALVAMAVFSSCDTAAIEITSPAEDQQTITTPFDLRVEHKGCGTINPRTFRALLDEGTSEQREISADFYHQSGIWTANQIELPAGSHTLTVKAIIRRGDVFCRVTSERDFHRFTVLAPVEEEEQAPSL